MSAVTDSENKVYYDPKNKPGISNLLVIYAAIEEKKLKEVEEYFKDYNYGNLKKEVALSVSKRLKAIQEKYNEITSSNELDSILNHGREVAEEIARAKYEEVLEKVGLGR